MIGPFYSISIMARPQQNSIEYFSLNVCFFDDPKLLFVSEKFGLKGEIIALKLLCWIYKNEGYYMQFNEEIAAIFCRKELSGVTSKELIEVVNELLNRSFFNKNLYEKEGVLSSAGIQKRWIEATKRRKSNIDKKYFLLSYCTQNDTETPTNDTETPQKDTETTSNDTEMRQSKVKESKVKESKVNHPPNPQKNDDAEIQLFGSKNQYDFSKIKWNLWNHDSSDFILSVKAAIGEGAKAKLFENKVTELINSEYKISDPKKFFTPILIEHLKTHDKW